MYLLKVLQDISLVYVKNFSTVDVFKNKVNKDKYKS